MRIERSRLVAWWRAAALVVLAGLASGCAAGAGGFTLFPTGHDLHPGAEKFRSFVPQPAPVPRELSKAAIQPYVVQPGDVLLIEPVNFESAVRLAVDQTVLVDGTIDLGQYGRPVVAGRTVEEIEAQVESLIEAVETEDTPVNVRLVNTQGAVFYVVGEVNAPGAYPLIGRETVLDAIMTAGGLTDRSDHGDIILSRPTHPEGCRIVLPVCWDHIVQLGDTTTNYQIMPGDRVFVATRSCWEGLIPGCLKKKSGPCCNTQCACGAFPPVPAPVSYAPYASPALPTYGPVMEQPGTVIEPPASVQPPPAPRVEASFVPLPAPEESTALVTPPPAPAAESQWRPASRTKRR